MKTKTIEITFTEEALGTASANPDIHDEFIASKAPDAPSRDEELSALIETEGLEEATEKQMTVFARSPEGNPVMWDYQIKGFFKDACGMLRRVDGTKSKKLTAFKKVIDGLIFVSPRQIPLRLPEGAEMGVCQRPLRAQTAQGERVALASSETVPAGTTMQLTVKCLNDKDMELVDEWLDYGELRGLSQWRNSGKGTFCWHEI